MEIQKTIQRLSDAFPDCTFTEGLCIFFRKPNIIVMSSNNVDSIKSSLSLLTDLDLSEEDAVYLAGLVAVGHYRNCNRETPEDPLDWAVTYFKQELQ